ncbi:MAG TPA: type II toxin-antitoxin system VapC family toxin [Actinocrinis sp.]|uniref:type II toxin-antitoxin system VapC family toxin n=1 Tax=Actinocrinis sp. TaxID=1920516 RepID=UPI002DDD5DA0|nr:type II toxin-antitoxin system VapC family toxin [Actinocrinis sp.]HEV2346232.1 type II toxin-antitoxin system VapC family toxin [Actinocrinis sp.]
MIYLDTSAALKLVVPETETHALELWLTERVGLPRVSSRLLRIGLLRAVGRYGSHRAERAQTVLSSISLMSIDRVASSAETVGDSLPRSLDAIHLATAQAMRPALTAFVTYDKRLASAATTIGLPVEAPA